MNNDLLFRFKIDAKLKNFNEFKNIRKSYIQK